MRNLEPVLLDDEAVGDQRPSGGVGIRCQQVDIAESAPARRVASSHLGALQHEQRLVAALAYSLQQRRGKLAEHRRGASFPRNRFWNLATESPQSDALERAEAVLMEPFDARPVEQVIDRPPERTRWKLEPRDLLSGDLTSVIDPTIVEAVRRIVIPSRTSNPQRSGNFPAIGRRIERWVLSENEVVTTPLELGGTIKKYERPAIVATYATKELRAEAAQVIAHSGQWNGWSPR